MEKNPRSDRGRPYFVSQRHQVAPCSANGEFEVVDVAATASRASAPSPSSPTWFCSISTCRVFPGGTPSASSSEGAGVHVLIPTVSEGTDDLVETLRAGATGYLLKNIETEALGGRDSRWPPRANRWFPPQMTAKLVQGCAASPRQHPTVTDHDKLSPREEISGLPRPR